MPPPSVSVSGLAAGLEKMRAAGLPEAAIETFRHHYERLLRGDNGLLSESELQPIDEIADAESLRADDDGAEAALERTVVLKLNGGLGTTMGLDRPKSLLVVKDGLSFLDIIARQVLHLRRRFGIRLPLVLMNSSHTREESLRALSRYPELGADVPIDFVQGVVPKLNAASLEPISWPDDPELEWAPPGHGDLYTALLTSGMLDRLLEHNYRYIFLSNSDNLGAVLAPEILAWFAREQLPFLMEVTERSEADRKGGHLARRRDDRLVLRELAQTPEHDLEAFQDVRRHRYFNTNNLWLDLVALADLLDAHGSVLRLPTIVNRKTVDPTDTSSPEVIQLETAAGAAISMFDRARALRVPRRRFAPVKTTDDLLVVRSDVYVLTDEARLELAAERGNTRPIVDLDKRFYKLLRDFDARFPMGPPSLVPCDRLTVVGDVAFGRGVVIRGAVRIEHSGPGQLRIDDGAVLEG
ncbi:MAG: UTP--glucose-1-phosphate uridylyltransferase [Gaiellaceae bacterium]